MMKVLLVLCFVVQSFAQSNLLLLMDDGESAFDFSSIETLVIDLNADNNNGTAILDASGNNYNAALTNSPTINAGVLNGHTTITFNGTNQMAGTDPFTFNQPNTIYYVIKEISYIANSRLINSNSGSNNVLIDHVGDPDIRFYAGAALGTFPKDIGNYHIYTFVCNGASSEMRLNNGTATTGNAGTNGWGGFTIANQYSATNYANIEFVRLLGYSGAHDTATQNLILNALNNLYNIY